MREGWIPPGYNTGYIVKSTPGWILVVEKGVYSWREEYILGVSHDIILLKMGVYSGREG